MKAEVCFFGVFLLGSIFLVGAADNGQKSAPGGEGARFSPGASEMQAMARSMTAMAETCKMMMEKEMASRPAKMSALSTLGALGTVALFLFVVLEVQWIRWWALKIKAEKQKAFPVA